MMVEEGEERTRQPSGKRAMRSRKMGALSGREGWIWEVMVRMGSMSWGVIWRQVGAGSAVV